MDGYRYRRRLPHWREPRAVYFITWRLTQGAPDLADEERSAVAEALHHFADARYRLIAFVVMNDHVHVVLEPADGEALEVLVHSWKSFTARRLQQAGRRGRVWQPEYFDRIVRDADELREKVTYIANNPAKRWPEIDLYPWVWVAADPFA